MLNAIAAVMPELWGEIAPGVDLQKDILDKMDFTPVLSPELKLMDERLFIDAAMGFVLPELASVKSWPVFWWMQTKPARPVRSSNSSRAYVCAT